MKKILAVAAIFLAVGTLAYSQSGQKALGVWAYVGDIELLNNAPTSDFNTAIAEEPTIRLDGSAGAVLLGAGDTTAPDVSFSRTAANVMGLASGDTFVGGSVIYESFVQGGTAADALDTQFFIVPTGRTMTVDSITAVWGVAESTGSMDVMVERLQGTEACASGDDLQTAAVDATTTANTVTTPALTATTANLTLAAGNRLCVDLTATPNEIENLVVTVALRVDS